jgi:hypothetical protein
MILRWGVNISAMLKGCHFIKFEIRGLSYIESNVGQLYEL